MTKRPLVTFAAIAAIVIGLWKVGADMTFYNAPKLDAKKLALRGQLGDMYGSVNSLFSGIAVAGVIYTLMLQTQELTEQRLGTKKTLGEMQRANTAQEAANELAKGLMTLQEQANRLTFMQMNMNITIMNFQELTGIGKIPGLSPEFAAETTKSLSEVSAKILQQLEALDRIMLGEFDPPVIPNVDSDRANHFK